MLQSWLGGGDPRLIAWAAHFASQKGDNLAFDQMSSLLERQALFSPVNTKPLPSSTVDQNEATAAVLDALIQQKAQSSSQIIRSVASGFPVQALLLASNLPPAEARSVLEDWYNARNGDASWHLLARIATMMLADHPPPEMVATVVNDAQEHLTITLKSEGGGLSSGSGSGVGCGDSGSSGPRIGWPIVFTYHLEENGNSQDPLLVAVDDDRLTYTRVPYHAGYGSCHGVHWLDANNRHRLIAHWLGITDAAMPWSIRADATITWTTYDAYLVALGQIVEQQHQAMRSTVGALVEKGLLSEVAATSVEPRLRLSILCDINPCPLGGGKTSPPQPTLFGVD